MLSLLLLLALQPARAACEEPAARVAGAEQAVLTVELARAKAELAAAVDALGCAPAAAPELLARIWLAEAVIASLEGRAEDAGERFVAAWRVAPDLWVAGYGEPMRASRNRAVLELASRPPGQLTLSPPPRAWTVWLDGRVVAPPLPVAAGLHLVQVGPAGGPVAFSRRFFQPPGEELTVGVDALEPAPAPAVATPAPTVATPAPPPDDAADDEALLAEREQALRVRASRDWGAIDGKTRGTDARAERLLEDYVARYADAEASAGALTRPVTIPQAQEAKARLETLAARRAEEEALEAEERRLQAELSSGERTGALTRPGLTLAVGGAGLRATSGDLALAPASYGGLGGEIALGLRFSLGERLALAPELGALGVAGARGEDVGGDETLPSASHLGFARLLLEASRGRLTLGLGPSYGLGVVRTSASVWTDTTEDATPAAFSGKIGVGGLSLGARYLIERGERLGLGPDLSVNVGSDGARLYTSGALGLRVLATRPPR